MSRPDIIGSFEKNRREKLRVALDQYGGVDLVDLRIVVALTESSDIDVPTKKGVSINVAKLAALIDLLMKAQARAVERGLIDATPAAGNG